MRPTAREDYYSRLALYFTRLRKLPAIASTGQKNVGARVRNKTQRATFGAALPHGGASSGVLAQLVQSATLTRWRSLVRAQYASRKPSRQCAVRVFTFLAPGLAPGFGLLAPSNSAPDTGLRQVGEAVGLVAGGGVDYYFSWVLFSWSHKGVAMLRCAHRVLVLVGVPSG